MSSESGENLKRKLNEAEAQFNERVGEEDEIELEPNPLEEIYKIISDGEKFTSLEDIVKFIGPGAMPMLTELIHLSDSLGFSQTQVVEALTIANRNRSPRDAVEAVINGMKHMLEIKKGKIVQPIVGVLRMEEDPMDDSIVIRYHVRISRKMAQEIDYDQMVLYEGIIAGFAERLHYQRENPY